MCFILNERTTFFASYCSSIRRLLRLSSLNLLERIENNMSQAFHKISFTIVSTSSTWLFNARTASRSPLFLFYRSNGRNVSSSLVRCVSTPTLYTLHSDFNRSDSVVQVVVQVLLRLLEAQRAFRITRSSVSAAGNGTYCRCRHNIWRGSHNKIRTRYLEDTEGNLRLPLLPCIIANLYVLT